MKREQTKVTYYTNEHGCEFTIRTFQSVDGEWRSSIRPSDFTEFCRFNQKYGWHRPALSEQQAIRWIEKTYA